MMTISGGMPFNDIDTSNKNAKNGKRLALNLKENMVPISIVLLNATWG